MTGIAFLSCFIVGCCLAFIRHPIFGLLTYVATYYLHPPSRWWGSTIPSLRWSLIAGLITLVSVLLQKRKKNSYLIKERRSFLISFSFFLGWLITQSLWALNPEMHSELIWLFIKYAILIWVITSAIDNEKHLLWFCWSHVFGCTYLGWIAYANYKGGRFEEFGGPDINEANAGALQLLSGVFIGSALFLLPKIKNKIATLISLPLIANAIILTASRSAFLAGAVGGIVFNFFSPKHKRFFILGMSILAVTMFLALTNQQYWNRINTLKVAGENIEGTDTGSGRLLIMKAQLEMFKSHPFGCGHRCTVALSPQYMDKSMLTGTGEKKGRASHNTAFSLLVEQGAPGIIFYILYLGWIAKQIVKLRGAKAESHVFKIIIPASLAILTSITIGDMFVDYLKSEVRFWFISIIILITSHNLSKEAANKATAGTPSYPTCKLPSKNL